MNYDISHVCFLIVYIFFLHQKKITLCLLYIHKLNKHKSEVLEYILKIVTDLNCCL